MRKIGMILAVLVVGGAASRTMGPTQDDGKYFVLPAGEAGLGAHHVKHGEVFGKYVEGYNRLVLEAVDKVQATAMDGGGYFVGVHAKPAESPIGYGLELFGKPLLAPPRKTSYCSGSSYTAFIEAMNLILPGGGEKLSADRLEALRMQEPDGGRREDGVKFWGKWNDDGMGTEFALVQYSGIGEAITPEHARPGDFANISWKSGLGHSVVFLGFFVDPETKEKKILYWSSQKGTNGLGDQASALTKVKAVQFVRIVHPEKIFTFDPTKKVNRDVPGDQITW